jgi:hypothetical protein
MQVEKMGKALASIIGAKIFFCKREETFDSK